MVDLLNTLSRFENLKELAKKNGGYIEPTLYVSEIETIINALEKVEKYEKQWIEDMNNPLEPLKLSSALNSELFKLEYRKANKPKEINILDYTVIYALKDCLDRYSK